MTVSTLLWTRSRKDRDWSLIVLACAAAGMYRSVGRADVPNELKFQVVENLATYRNPLGQK
jgi:hypothetical protein